MTMKCTCDVCGSVKIVNDFTMPIGWQEISAKIEVAMERPEGTPNAYFETKRLHVCGECAHPGSKPMGGPGGIIRHLEINMLAAVSHRKGIVES